MTAAAALACRRCSTPIEEADLRCCICALAVPAPAQAAEPVQVALAGILRCRECAAAVAYDAEHGAPSCAFCGSIMEVEQPADPIERAEWLLPFQVDRDAAQHALRRWMRSVGWFRPSDLSSAATVESLRPLHWAAWIFDADAHVTWAADSDHDAGRSAWAPHAGSAGFKWRSILVSASRGLSQRETARLTPGYRLDTQREVPYETSCEAIERDPCRVRHEASDLEGDSIEAFDTQRSAARRTIVEAIESIAERQLIEHGHIPGRTFRNVRTSVLLSRLATRRVVLPSWVLAYRYKGSLYRSIVHGQDVGMVFGEAPVSWGKILALVLGAVLLVALLVGFLAA
jgi:hypothetical protein